MFDMSFSALVLPLSNFVGLITALPCALLCNSFANSEGGCEV